MEHSPVIQEFEHAFCIGTDGSAGIHSGFTVAGEIGCDDPQTSQAAQNRRPRQVAGTRPVEQHHRRIGHTRRI